MARYVKNQIEVEAVRFVYEYDNDVNVVTDEGDTLMHASVTGTANGGTQEAQQRIVEVIEFLCDRGAKPDELNKADRTPTDLADGAPVRRRPPPRGRTSQTSSSASATMMPAGPRT